MVFERLHGLLKLRFLGLDLANHALSANWKNAMGRTGPAHEEAAEARSGRRHIRRSRQSDREQEQEGNQEREDAQSFGHGEAEDQIAGLAGGSGGIAQRTREKAPEDVGHADSGACHAETSDTGADELSGFSFHFKILSEPRRRLCWSFSAKDGVRR